MTAAGLAAAALLVAVLVLVGTPTSTSTATARAALDALATAQTSVKDAGGGYASYWRSSADRALEASDPTLASAPVTDLRAIACDEGWVGVAVLEGVPYLRSSEGDAVSDSVAGLELPACVTDFAVEAMLDDLGVGAPTPQADPASFDRPAGASDYRPSYHLTPPRDWMNDPQRPFFLDGQWHYYYLYNADYPEGNGTAWYHVTSTDLVHWKDEGVAIEKYTNGLGDIWTGSAVIDHGNTAGFGEDAVVAMVTQQHDGVQRQSLFFSTDGGYTFSDYDGNPVMDNPGEEHWRDPKIIWDEVGGQWVMVLAEGHKLGFYTSPDLKVWRYVSGFERDDLGILECPDLFQLDVDGDPAKRTWVLAASANGAEEGRTTGFAYWTGDWDGTSFSADGEHRWMDDGADFYATVTWDDPRLTEGQRMASRHAIGWMNNWAYAGELPTEDWHGGTDSIVRDIRLATVDGRATIVSTPTRALARLEGEPSVVRDLVVDEGSSATRLPDMPGGAYRLDVSLERRPGDASEARIILKGDDESWVSVGYDFEAQQAFVARDLDRAAPLAGDDYREVRTAAVPAVDGRVELSIWVDYSSVEVFVDSGRTTLTSLVFPTPGAERIDVVTTGGELLLRSFAYTPLATAGGADRAG